MGEYLKRRDFLIALGTGAAALAVPGCRGIFKKKTKFPNIVYIIADDMGYGDVGCLNPDCKIPTPYMNRLAEQGMVFKDAHAGASVCTPTRYGILTGRYSWRTRLKSGVLGGYSPPLIKKDRMTVASLLKQYGYSTACVGKWHLGWNWRYREGYADGKEKEYFVDYTKPIINGPLSRGFDYFFGIPASLDMPPYVYIENRKALKPASETTEGSTGYEFYRSGPIAPGFEHSEVMLRLTKEAVGFIDKHAKTRSNDPFFLYFPFSAPHTPILPNKRFVGKSGIGAYGDFVFECDWAVGQFMKALEKHGMTENTLIIVTSDNGCSPKAGFEDLADQGHFPSYHFRGYKADIYEGGHRIPFIARWPNQIKPGTECRAMICLTDLLATVADLTGYELPDNTGEDSISILPYFSGEAEEPERDAVVHHSINGSFAIRKGKWKLELCPGSGGWSHPTPKEAKKLNLPQFQLYDLSKDIEEENNLYNERPDIVSDLISLLKEYVEKGRSTPGAPQENVGKVNIFK